jgi:L-asparaginase II
MSEVLVEVRRADCVESVHRGSIVIADVTGEIIAWAGDPDYYTFMRSSAKPIQALAVVESGAYEAFGLSERELAIMCASHSSEPYHVETVLGILRKLGLDEAHLVCGTHLPTHAPSAQALLREGRRPTAVHSNCSGKHSGMLALAKQVGWSLDDYWREDHPVQKLCLENLAAVSDYPVSGIGLAKDGCGVAVFALPLRSMAQAFARLANPEAPGSGFSPERAGAATLVGRAMRAYPEMVGGTGRLCTELMRATPVVAKGGAEGVYCFGVPGRGLGCALKIDDGASRATSPVVLKVIEGLGLLTPEAAAVLKTFRRPENTNNRGDVIGISEAVFGLAAREKAS